MATGDITEISQPYMFNTGKTYHSCILHIHGNVYAIAYNNATNGYIKTVDISDDGITISNLQSTGFGSSVYYSKFIHVRSNVYAVLYRNYDWDVYATSFIITHDGSISVSDSKIVTTESGYAIGMVHIHDGICAFFHGGTANQGKLKTIDIDTSGSIGITGYTRNITGYWGVGRDTIADIINVSGDMYAIVYDRENSYAVVLTIDIYNDGSIGNPNNNFIISQPRCYSRPRIVHIASSPSMHVCAISSNIFNGPSQIDNIKILHNGTIDSIINSLSGNEQDTYGSILHIDDDIYLIAYDHGIIKTYEISADIITMLSSHDYSAGSFMSSTILLSTGLCAIVYDDVNGIIRTFGISRGHIASHPRFTTGLSHRSFH